MSKHYDQIYFDRWYRTPRQRVGLRSLLERKVALAVAVAEYHLDHRVQSVLDVGCGEGAWRAPLLKLFYGTLLVLYLSAQFRNTDN